MIIWFSTSVPRQISGERKSFNKWHWHNLCYRKKLEAYVRPYIIITRWNQRLNVGVQRMKSLGKKKNASSWPGIRQWFRRYHIKSTSNNNNKKLTTINIRKFSSPHKETPYALDSFTIIPQLSQRQAMTNLISVSIDLPNLEISHK